MADERLLTVVDDLHGTVRVQREQRAVHLHRQILAAAERTTDAGEMDAHLRELEVEAGRDLRAVDVQPLGRHIDVDTALPVRYGKARFRPEKRLVLNADLVDAFDAHVTDRVRIAVSDHHVPDDVRAVVLAVAVAVGRLLGMQVGLLGRALHVGDRLELLVVDDDALGGAAGLLGMLGGDERDRLAVVEDAVDREHRLIGELEAVRLRAREHRRG